MKEPKQRNHNERNHKQGNHQQRNHRRRNGKDAEVPGLVELADLEERFFAEELKAARLRAGLNKAQVARRGGVSASQVGQAERRANGFSYRVAARMSRASRVRTSTLARRAEKRAWAVFCQSNGYSKS